MGQAAYLENMDGRCKGGGIGDASLKNSPDPKRHLSVFSRDVAAPLNYSSTLCPELKLDITPSTS